MIKLTNLVLALIANRDSWKKSWWCARHQVNTMSWKPGSHSVQTSEKNEWAAKTAGKEKGRPLSFFIKKSQSPASRKTISQVKMCSIGGFHMLAMFCACEAKCLTQVKVDQSLVCQELIYWPVMLTGYTYPSLPSLYFMLF